jgi:hypothetical protein
MFLYLVVEMVQLFACLVLSQWCIDAGLAQVCLLGAFANLIDFVDPLGDPLRARWS